MWDDSDSIFLYLRIAWSNVMTAATLQWWETLAWQKRFPQIRKAFKIKSVCPANMLRSANLLIHLQLLNDLLWISGPLHMLKPSDQTPQPQDTVKPTFCHIKSTKFNVFYRDFMW